MPLNKGAKKKPGEGRTAGSPAASKSKSQEKKSSLLIYNVVTVVLVVGICFCGYTVAIKKIDDSTAAGVYNAVNDGGRLWRLILTHAGARSDCSGMECFPTDYIPPLGGC